MALTPGTRLGPYEIVAPIGAGGMGEVYRAKDTRLGREVAIKVLPAHLSGEAAALNQLEREAKAVAALSHPNILAIHDFGEASGLTFAVMELLEGETLRERLKAGALSVRKVVDLGVQMANGLAAAHDKGIVHRDLKPENLFLTKSGVVKILDFGLAGEGGVGSNDDPANAPTLRPHSTPGTVMGTIGYMAPEQACGEPADQRSDVFSLGCVLYEMISGRRAFHGQSAAETMMAILSQEPPDTTTSGSRIPPALDRIVRHCLEKRPGERFQSARDLAFDLQSVTLSESSAGLVAARGRRRRGVLWAAAAALVILTAVGAGTLVGRRLTVAEPPSFHQVTFNRGVVRSARFSPDGQTLVYGAGWNGRPFELYASRMDGVAARTFGLPPGDVLGISDTGDMVLLVGRPNLQYLMAVGTLARSHVSGGAQREILDGVSDGDLTRDGSALAIVRRIGGRDRLVFPIGTVLFSSDGWLQHPRISSDGARIAFIEHPLLGDDRGFVAMVDRNGGTKRLTKEWTAVQGLA